MYGLVNRGIEELVTTVAGADAWDRVRTKAGLVDEFFIAMDSYDDAITYRLVEAASEVLEMSPSDVLERFGRYWILYTGAEGWGPILDSLGTSVAEVLSNLDAMHIRIQTTMPSLVMPRFVTTHSDADLIEFEYHSEREGLAPMVTGIIKGLAERFDETWFVEHVGTRCDDGLDTFRLVAHERAERLPA